MLFQVKSSNFHLDTVAGASGGPVVPQVTRVSGTKKSAKEKRKRKPVAVVTGDHEDEEEARYQLELKAKRELAQKKRDEKEAKRIKDEEELTRNNAIAKEDFAREQLAAQVNLAEIRSLLPETLRAQQATRDANRGSGVPVAYTPDSSSECNFLIVHAAN